MVQITGGVQIDRSANAGVGVGAGIFSAVDSPTVYFDAANYTSYSGSGTVWNDISGNGDSANLRNTAGFITYNPHDPSWEFAPTATSSTTGFAIQNLNYADGTTNITNLTLEAWVKPSTGTGPGTNDERIICSFDRSSVFRFGLGADYNAAGAGKPCLAATGGIGDAVFSNSPDLRTGRWHHVVITVDTGTDELKCYVDGVLVQTITGTYSAIDPGGAETPRYGYIGNGSEATSAGGTIGPSHCFTGSIGLFRMWDDKTLTAQEVAQNYRALVKRRKQQLGLVQSRLLMHIDAEDYPGTGTTVTDKTGNGYNATLAGNVSHSVNVLSYDGGQTADYLYFDVSALQALTTPDRWTIDSVIRLDSTTGTTYFHSMATTSSNNYYLVQKINAGVSAFSETLNSGSSMTFSAGETFLLTIVSNGTTQSYYKNGVLAATYTAANDIRQTEGWVLNQEQDSVLGSFDSTQCTDMGMYAVRLYDKALTAAEVKQNYDAVKTRYSI